MSARAGFTGQQVFVQDSDNLTIAIGDAESFSDNLDVLTSADLTISGGTGQNVVPNVVSLRSTNGKITLSQDLKADLMTLRAKLDLVNTGVSSVNGTLVNLISETGSIGSAGQRLVVQQPSRVTLTSLLGGFIQGNGGFSFSNASASLLGGTFDLISDGNIDCQSGATINVNLATIATSNGDINIPGFFTSNTVTLHATKNIFNGGIGFGDFLAGKLTMIADTGTIGSGTGGNFRASASELDIHAPLQSALIQNGVSTAIDGGSSAASQLTILAAGDLTTAGSGSINAGTITLNGVNLNFGLDVQATTAMNITAQKNISTVGGAILKAPAMNISTQTGLVGTDANSRLNIDADQLNYNTSGAAQGAFLFDANGLTLTGVNLAKGGFDLSVGGPLTVNGALTTLGGDLNLTQSAGTMTIAAGNTLSSDKNISLAITDISKTAKKTSIFNFGANSKIQAVANTAGLGNVLISVGAPGVPTAGKKPRKNVQAIVNNGGLIFFGKKGITAKLAPDNILTADGANITFNNFLNKKCIVLGGGVAITADPPVTSSALASADSGEPMASANLVSSTNLITLPNSTSLPTDVLQPGIAQPVVQSSSAIAASSTTSLDQLQRTQQLVSNLPYDSYITTYGDSPIIDAMVHNRITAEETLPAPESQARLFLPDGDLSFQLQPDITCDIASGSAVLIVSKNGTISIYDVHDRHKGAVKLNVKGNQFLLNPGRHLTIAPLDSGEFSDVNLVHAIPHRSVSDAQLLDRKIYHSEFSIVSAINSIKPLKQLMASNRSEERRKSKAIAKTVAIKMIIDGNSPYKPQVKPTLAALPL